ncbi:MAG: hypothetical protein SV375_10540 [Thermodesulfobacteriota bacterium]|nr:hypothetical protein [Thermodesulfobacteriota bacterium]
MKRCKYFDPYDLWSTPLGINIRRTYYHRKAGGIISAIGLGFFDWLLPEMVRKIIRTTARLHPITFAQFILIETLRKNESIEDPLLVKSILELLRYLSVDPNGKNNKWAWGLRFSWMSKNGFYGPDTPFVTHTPYVMEALIALNKHSKNSIASMEMFYGTYVFLESLLIMHRKKGELAMSYSPRNEPRIVINANAYACFAYSMHACYGKKEIRDLAAEKAKAIARWIVKKQYADGSWAYFADDMPGNFIDCFHSCFVIKNLIKAANLLPELEEIIHVSIEGGWHFIQDNMYDKSHKLCRRFIVRDIKDPFKWDLYDQAEYLGLLIDFGLIKEAHFFREYVKAKFSRRKNWWCKIDIFNRPWGYNFLRWGIVPFWYHSSRLDAVSNKL